MEARGTSVAENLALVELMIKRLNVPPHIHLDDLRQEGAIALMNAEEKWNPDISRFSTYACRAIRNALIHYIGFWSRRTRCDSALAAAAEQGQIPYCIEEVPHNEAPLDLMSMQDAMQTLTPREQTIIVLRYKCDQTFARIARELHIGREQVRKAHNAALEKMRGFYERHDGDDQEGDDCSCPEDFAFPLFEFEWRDDAETCGALRAS